MSTLVDSTLSNTLQALSRALLALGPEADFPLDPRLADLITSLPRLAESDVDTDGVCPICLVSFRAHLAEEEMASVMESPTHAPEGLGVTRLENTCKHMFCRKDIVTWIRQARNSCPTCRRPLLPIDQPATSNSTPTDLSTSNASSSLDGEASNSRDAASHSNATGANDSITTVTGDNTNNINNASAHEDSASSSNLEEQSIQDDPETAAARLVNDVIRDVLDRISLGPSESGLTNTDLHTLLESVLPTLIPTTSQTESSDIQDLESEHEYPARSEFNSMYS